MLRFAFYGRLSTKEHQDPETSWRWQLECAGEVVERAGTIVAQFFGRRVQPAPVVAAAARRRPARVVFVGDVDETSTAARVLLAAEHIVARTR